MLTPKKLHLCCGDVYLQGYVNCDIVGTLPEAENPNLTTLENYYKRPFDLTRGQGQIIIDDRVDVCGPWPWQSDSIDEVLMIACIEHFTPVEADRIFNEAYRVLRSGGVFHFDFPDLKETLSQFYDKKPEFMMRLLYCSNKNEFSVHKWGYTPKMIDRLFRQWGVVKVGPCCVKHDYPEIGVTATK